MDSLPEEALKSILGYVGDARALLSCERSCSTFRSILADDEIWRHSCREYCINTDRSVGSSYREKAFIGKILGEIKEDQKRSGRENIILSVFSPELVRRIINRYIVGRFLNIEPCSNMSFDVRGDTLQCLLDIAQAYMVQKFEFAQLTAVRASVNRNNDDYPAVLINDMRLIERIQGTRFCTNNLMVMFAHDDLREIISGAMDAEFNDNDGARFKLARRLANRAGVVKMTTEVMEKASIDVFMVLANILWRPMLIHRDILVHETRRFEYDSIDLWEDIPPSIERTVANGEIRHDCVIVPGQIEESASEIGVNMINGYDPSTVKVYGHHIWALSVEQSLGVAIATAKRRYMVSQVKREEGEDTDEYGSLSDSDADSFSEYDDEECPDDNFSKDEDEMEIDLETL